jgi:cellulose synthase/poly-beta-1,6-N-acetylglucosamine synthase-like glycosyltransferase
MTSDSVAFLLFWGVWILIPLVVDVARSLADAWTVWRFRGFARPYPPLPHRNLPKVSILIPAYNEQLDVDRCITSLKAQTYPHHLIEILVINDGSTDRTEEVVNGHINGTPHWNGHIRLHNRIIPAREFGGVMTLVQGEHKGKPAAVNLGLARCRGELVFTIDSDVVLEPEAVEQAVAAFQADPHLAAATAHLIVDPNLLVESDGNGHIHLDSDDLPVPRRLSTTERFLAACQFFEYLQAFRIGRHAEAVRRELFTLSGACAVFRREVLLEMKGYRGRTVSEDTDATLSLQRRANKVGYLPQVRVHLAPTVSWTALFSQRVRWQRGELEVLAVNADLLGKGTRFWRRSMPRRLQNDHALALMRLVWGFLLPLFPLLGYETSMIAQAAALMYAVYITTDAILLAVAWPIASPAERRLLRISAQYLPWLPLYRMIVYAFRLSGILRTLSDRPQWNTTNNWADRIRLPGSRQLRSWLGSLLKAWAD